MTFSISPISCIPLIRFFFIDIYHNLLYWVVSVDGKWGLAADFGQHLAVCGHGLNQILSKSVLHNKNTSKLSVKSFSFVAGSDAPLNQAWRYYITGILFL